MYIMLFALQFFHYVLLVQRNCIIIILFCIDVPDIPQIILSDKISDRTGGCLIHILWNTPTNIAAGDVDYYLIFINGQNQINESSNDNLTSAVYSACNCEDYNVSIRAVSRCGSVGPNTQNFTLNRDPKSLPALTCDVDITSTDTASGDETQCGKFDY